MAGTRTLSSTCPSPDWIRCSPPGWSPEFGEDPTRYADTRAVTRASGRARAVLARHSRNRRLADVLYQQAFAALSAPPGARAFYDAHRARGNSHDQGRPYAHWPTASSASCTAACATSSPSTKPPHGTSPTTPPQPELDR
ncbi:hypothetical protein GCM10023199_14300 [Actinomycetospora chibensis]